MSKNFKKHTLFILTRNRTKWIEYSLNFYAKFKYKGRILIADDSDENIFKQNSILVNNFKDILDINHIKGRGRNLPSRKKRYCLTRYYAIQEIDTEYYSQTGDDDIVFTPELFKAIEFLDNNKDYNYVQGSTVQVQLNENMEIINLEDTWWPECKYEDPLDRISHYANKPGCPLLGVNRVKPLKDLLKIEDELGWPPFARKNTDGLEYFDEELSWSLQIYASGKIGRIKDCLLYFRLKTTPIENEDRVENLYLHDDLSNNYVIGPIANIYDGHLTSCINETHKEILSFLKFYGTRYSEENCNFQISQCLWSLLSRYNGAGLLKIKSKFSEENKPTIKKSLMTQSIKGILKFLLIIKNFKFYFKLKIKKNFFTNKHNIFKKKIFRI